MLGQHLSHMRRHVKRKFIIRKKVKSEERKKKKKIMIHPLSFKLGFHVIDLYLRFNIYVFTLSYLNIQDIQ
jgi:hypothetical protein